MTAQEENVPPPRPATAPEPGRTLGVEEEFLLVDARTRRIAGLAGPVIERARRMPPPAPDAVLQRELSAAQVEAATGVATDLPELVRQLDGARRTLAAAARAEGGRLVSTGLPVLDGAAPLSGGERYAAIARLYERQAAGYLACGCHVHVGVPDRETAVAVVNWLRPWLPVLLALSANSPWDRGRDSGYASWRVMDQARFPGSGIPPRFGSAAEHDAEVARLVECGVLVDPAMTFWLARPSPHLPTVEVRAADALGTTWETALQAALTRALVATALTDLAAGREAPAVPAQLASAALWTAARFGLDGHAVDPVRETRVPARALLGRLLARLAPALEATGDLPFVRGAVRALHLHGTGAVRQRRAGTVSGPTAAVDMLAAQTEGAPPPGRRAHDCPAPGLSGAGGESRSP